MNRHLPLVLLLAACKPELDDDASRADTPRVLAIRVEPPEAKPLEKVELRVLYTDGTTAPAAAPVGLGFCLARKALAESGSIAAECLAYEDARLPLGAGDVVSGVVPRDACRVFGPDPPLAANGAPAGRPIDPDPTGGYYQPGLVIGRAGAVATFDVRLRCGLPGATQAQVADYEAHYAPNKNPTIARAEPAGAEIHAARGARLRFRVGWAPEDAESFVAYDLAARAVVPRREAMRVSWLATRGAFASARTGRDETDLATDTENDLAVPDRDGDLSVVIVLRDSRGGTDFRVVRVTVP